jgi:hypothetical protein
MSSRASYPAAFLWIASLVLSAGVGACAGTSVSEFTVSTADDAGAAVVHPVDAAAEDAVAPEGLDGSADTMAAAAVYQGNPLCNASQATSCCYPDALNYCGPAPCESPSDAGADAGGGGYSQPVEYGCHLVPTPPPSSAVMGSTPRPDAQVLQSVTPSCTPAGLLLDGSQCHGPADCAPGYECVGSPGTCRHYCCSGNTSCRIDQFCDIQPTASGSSMEVPVCMPAHTCDLLQPGTCPSGQTCAVVREDGSLSCVQVGAATAGKSCQTEHCASDLVCLGAATRTCYALCKVGYANQCPGSQTCKGGLPLFVDPSVGVCQ